jgi:hypothetical protein
MEAVCEQAGVINSRFYDRGAKAWAIFWPLHWSGVAFNDRGSYFNRFGNVFFDFGNNFGAPGKCFGHKKKPGCRQHATWLQPSTGLLPPSAAVTGGCFNRRKARAADNSSYRQFHFALNAGYPTSQRPKVSRNEVSSELPATSAPNAVLRTTCGERSRTTLQAPRGFAKRSVVCRRPGRAWHTTARFAKASGQGCPTHGLSRAPRGQSRRATTGPTGRARERRKLPSTAHGGVTKCDDPGSESVTDGRCRMPVACFNCRWGKLALIVSPA